MNFYTHMKGRVKAAAQRRETQEKRNAEELREASSELAQASTPKDFIFL